MYECTPLSPLNQGVYDMNAKAMFATFHIRYSECNVVEYKHNRLRLRLTELLLILHKPISLCKPLTVSE